MAGCSKVILGLMFVLVLLAGCGVEPGVSSEPSPTELLPTDTLVPLTATATATGTPVPPTAVDTPTLTPAAPTPTTEPVPATALRVASRRVVMIAFADILSLSPDGQWLAVLAEDGSLCLYDASTEVEVYCVELQTGPVDGGSVAWSPDSGTLAFTEKAPYESDIWILDIETHELVDLTDDEVSDDSALFVAAQFDQRLAQDINPVWTLDGQALLFARQGIVGDVSVTGLYTVSVHGGDAQQLLAMPVDEPLVPGGMLRYRWSSDGSQIVYSLALEDPHAAEGGLWVLDRDGSHRERVPVPGLKRRPILIDVSPQGGRALILYTAYWGETDVSWFSVVDLETGETEPVIPEPKEGQTGFTGPLNVIFSTDGSKLLYTFHHGGTAVRLAVSDLDDGAPQILHSTYVGTIGLTNWLGVGLDWAQNDLVWATGWNQSASWSFDRGVLIQLVTR